MAALPEPPALTSRSVTDINAYGRFPCADSLWLWPRIGGHSELLEGGCGASDRRRIALLGGWRRGERLRFCYMPGCQHPIPGLGTGRRYSAAEVEAVGDREAVLPPGAMLETCGSAGEGSDVKEGVPSR